MNVQRRHKLPRQLMDTLKKHIHKEKLPDNFLNTVETFYWPIVCEIVDRLKHIDHDETGPPFFLGVQGAQGSGKSTLASFIKLMLEQGFAKNCLVLSIDDFYRTKAERKALGSQVHPLLTTRGVPGTHDIDLFNDTWDSIKQIGEGQTLDIVTFDKSLDDRAAKKDWQRVSMPQDVVILEGWCVGVSAQKKADLIQSINALETHEDADGRWRQYVNEQIQHHYQPVYDQFNGLVVLQSPSFECVLQWRTKQERKLIEKLQANNQPLHDTMSPTQIKRFISYYQRLTEHAMETLPEKADWLLMLHANHAVTNLVQRANENE